MDFKDAVKQLLRDNDKTQLWLANELGSRSQSRVSKMLENNNITIKNLIALCEVFGYEILLQPKSADHAPYAVVIDHAGKSSREDKAAREREAQSKKLSAQLLELQAKQEKINRALEALKGESK